MVVSVLFRNRTRCRRLCQNTHDFARLIWSQASPDWKFSDATFNASAKSPDNPDHVAVTLSNYRWRLGLEKASVNTTATSKSWRHCQISPFRQSPSKAATTGRHILRRKPMPVNSPVNMNTAPLGPPWGTTRRRRIRRISSRRLSTRISCDMCYFQYVTPQSGDPGGAY